MRYCVQCLLVLLLLADMAAAGTITVRKDGTGNFTVLQQALSAAADGDSVLIGPGEFTEMPWVRLPGDSWDVQACGYITANNLTIIGAGADQTFIGPTVYSGNNNLYSPKAFVYWGSGNLSLRDLTVRNCYDGVYVKGTLFMEQSSCLNNHFGVYWQTTGAGGWIRNTRFDATTPQYPDAMYIYGSGSDILIEGCQATGGETLIKRIRNMTIINSDFSRSAVGISIYDDAQVFIHQSTVSNMEAFGVKFVIGSGGYCEIHDSDISGSQSALDTGGNATNCRFAVYDSRIRGGTIAALYARYRPGACIMRNCDFIKGSGPVVQCGPSYTAVTHDLTNNYWGTSSTADIQSWIIDKNDDRNIAAAVLYSPFAGQPVPTETTTWGDLKALWR